MPSPAAAASLLVAALLLAVSPTSGVAPDPADARAGLDTLRTDIVATVVDPKLQAKLTKAVDKALAKAEGAPTEKKAAKGYKKTRNAVRGVLKKLGWKEEKGLLQAKKRQKLDRAVSDPLRDRSRGCPRWVGFLMSDKARCDN